MPKNIAQVVVGLPVEGPFDYGVPESMKAQIAEGHRVLVSFGRKSMVGFVVGFQSGSAYKNVKPVLSLLDNRPALDGYMLEFTRQFAEYYACSRGEAIETCLPDLLRKKTPQTLSVPDIVPAQPVTKKSEKACVKLVHDQGLTQRWPYLVDLIRQTMAQKKSVIVLVPEVFAIDKLKSVLKENQLEPAAVIDKRLTDKEEIREWLAIKEGKARLVIGTRSAVFVPAASLGLIIVLDEENSAYKQEQSPSYHVRDVARMRSGIEGCTVVFVSSTPSAEIWYETRHATTDRVTLEPGPLGKIQMIDMSNYKPGKRSFISFPMQNHIQKTLESYGKVVLFLNRKGFSTSTRCNQCGHVMKCERCNVSLTYLYSKKQLVCHLCNEAHPLPDRCVKCQSSYIRYLGTGIEKIQSELARIFPQARIARFDKDTDVMPAGANIIIATQAILKQLGPSAVDLAGILEIDAEFNRPDFRSAQRVFSLLVRFRQAVKDKVVVQTYNPSNYALKAADKFDFKQFYKEELALRKEMGFPPYSHLVAIGLRGMKEDVVFDQAKALYEELAKHKQERWDILEPQPDFMPKLRDKYRFTIMVKTHKVNSLLVYIKKVFKSVSRKRNVIITVNVDP